VSALVRPLIEDSTGEPVAWPPRASMGRVPAWTITAVLALVYLILAPASSDLAAATYRSDLFSRVGFTLWDNSWYGGHHLPAYSVLAPALGATLGPRLLAALSMTVAAAIFAALIRGRFAARATRLAAAWFALGAAISLLSSRVPFDLGLALGLGALLLAQRRRPAEALPVVVLTSLASPVAGAFLALAFLAWALAGPARGWPAALTLVALAPIGLLALVFPEGGTQPFDPSAFYPALAGVVLIALVIPPEHRALRIGTVLYALALSASFVLPTAVGANADRLGALAGGPVAACVLAGAAIGPRRRRDARAWLLILLAPALLYWQANAPVADFAAAAWDPGVKASYYAPLLRELHTLGVGYAATPARIEVVPLTDHWEARWVAPDVMLARGWERQLDRYRNGLFYDESTPLTAPRYGAWLSAQSVSYVALADAALDYSATSEARLLGGAGAGPHPPPPGYLREVWRSAHWRLFAVLGPTPLVRAPAHLTHLDTDSFTLQTPVGGVFTVRLHFTPYWALAAGQGCVARAPGDWTEVRARSAGSYRVIVGFSLARVFGHGPRCR
jgi:hypothetical protein